MVREKELQKLRQFDLDWRFGPCTGNIPTHAHIVKYSVWFWDKNNIHWFEFVYMMRMSE